MRKIIIPLVPVADDQARRIAEQEGEMLKHISSAMNSMRLVGIIPQFQNFQELEAWWLMSKEWTNRQKTKYKAWWDAIYTLLRDKNDVKTVALIVACCLQEKAKRAYSTEPPLDPNRLQIDDQQHIKRVREYVRDHYKQLDPEMGIE